MNEHVNLTAIKDPEEFTLKHFVDSVTSYNTVEYQDSKKILDLGTGAGFPGIPLAILSPEKEFVLMDSLNKRLKIIMNFCQELGINNVTTVHGRAEDLARQEAHREKYDLCISRAVANLMYSVNIVCLMLRLADIWQPIKVQMQRTKLKMPRKR